MGLRVSAPTQHACTHAALRRPPCSSARARLPGGGAAAGAGVPARQPPHQLEWPAAKIAGPESSEQRCLLTCPARQAYVQAFNHRALPWRCYAGMLQQVCWFSDGKVQISMGQDTFLCNDIGAAFTAIKQLINSASMKSQMMGCARSNRAIELQQALHKQGACRQSHWRLGHHTSEAHREGLHNGGQELDHGLGGDSTWQNQHQLPQGQEDA